MTARSGDALSHVYFQAGQNTVLTVISAPEFCRGRRGDLHASPTQVLVPAVFAWRPWGGIAERTRPIRFICPLLA